MLLVFINLKGRKNRNMKRSTKSTSVQQNVFEMLCYLKKIRKKKSDEPVSEDLPRVQKRRVSSFVHDPVAASFVLGPKKVK